MLKITFHNNKEKIKNYHIAKYKEAIMIELDSIITTDKTINNFVKDLKDNIENILVGEPKKLCEMKELLKPRYEKIKDKNIKYRTKDETLDKRLRLIFNYDNFRDNKIYINAKNKIDGFKSDINSIKYWNLKTKIRTLEDIKEKFENVLTMIENGYNNPFYKIDDITSNYKEKNMYYKQCKKSKDNIVKDYSQYCDDIKKELHNRRNEFWRDYDNNEEIKNKEIIKEIWGGDLFIKELGIITCPYCNRIYTNVIRGKKKNYKPALDHFYSKDKYPYLRISLFNLVPCCNICNSTFKSNDDKDVLNPYEKGYEDDYLFKFDILDNSKEIIKSNLEVSLELLNVKNNKYNIKNSYEMFEIESAYNSHKDIVVDMIKLREKYTIEEIDRLVEDGVFNSREEFIEKIILKGPIDKEDFNNNAFSKFKRDIAYQLGYINIVNDIN